jgi:hypothetical protein
MRLAALDSTRCPCNRRPPSSHPIHQKTHHTNTTREHHCWRALALAQSPGSGQQCLDTTGSNSIRPSHFYAQPLTRGHSTQLLRRRKFSRPPLLPTSSSDTFPLSPLSPPPTAHLAARATSPKSAIRSDWCCFLLRLRWRQPGAEWGTTRPLLLQNTTTHPLCQSRAVRG